jgi:DNA-binding YbaB/EbfC family protein
MNIHKLMKQAQQMQQQLAKVQEEAAAKTVEGVAGGGMVKAVASGDGKIVSITIDPEVLTQNDKEMLEDLVLAAVNTAIDNAKAMTSEEMKKAAGGFNMPGLENML